MLYTVHYTSRHVVSRFNDKGVKVGEYTTDIPQTITALPHTTAMQYKACDNFRIEQYQMDNRSSGKSQYVHRKSESDKKPSAAKTAKPVATSIQKAAAVGDLASAVSGAK